MVAGLLFIAFVPLEGELTWIICTIIFAGRLRLPFCLLYSQCKLEAKHPTAKGNSFMKVVMKHVNDEPQLFAGDEQAMALESVIFKARAKDPADRHDSMDELKEGLQYCLCLLENEDVSSFSELVWLGFWHFEGLGKLASDYKRAVRYYKEAAENGSEKAMRYLGYHYDKGYGVTADAKVAAHWYRQAVELNDAESKYYLALLYRDGRGVNQDTQRYMELLEEAAHGDVIDAVYELGLEEMEQGKRKSARVWFLRAQELGHIDSADRLTELG